MSSHVWTVPTHRVEEFTDVPPQYDMGSCALPVLTEPGFKTEVSLDFQGRNHLYTSENGDGVYALQDDMFSSHAKFTMPGRSSASTLRHYLHEHLRPHQIVDEYGDESDLSDVSNDQLLVLQSKMWTKVSNCRSLTQATGEHPSRAQIVIVSHVSKLSQLLEEKHIFVLSNTEHDTCDYQSNLQDNTKHSCHSQIVRIEPLVHWGTVTPVTASQYILAFRRDGDLMHVPAYKYLVRSLVDETVPSYCVDCLAYLWSRRAEAHDVRRQIQGIFPRSQSCSSDELTTTQIKRPFKNPGCQFGRASTLVVGGTLGLAACQSQPAEIETHKNPGMTQFQLDGASDYHSDVQTQPLSSSDHDHGAVWENLDSREDSDNDSEPTRCSDSCILALRTTSASPTSSVGCSTRAAPPFADSATIDNTPKKAHWNSSVTLNKYKFRIKAQKTPTHTKERRFGREIDPNSTVPPVQVRRSPRKHKESSISQENVLSVPIRPMKPLKAKKTNNSTKETKKRKTAPVEQRTGKQQKAHTADPKELKPDKPEPLVNITAGFRYLPASEPTNLPLTLTVHFAKRPPVQDTPEGIAPQTHEAFRTMHPEPSSRICWCNEPASHSTTKKPDPHIAQCTNRDCRFKWYHYACLSQSDKGKARWGNLICQHCRNEEEFAAKNKCKGNMVQHMDFGKMWTKEGIEVEMPGMGGNVPVVNPYGLGVEICLGSAYTSKAQDRASLGGLGSFGYALSRPCMLEEVYLNTGANGEAGGRGWFCET